MFQRNGVAPMIAVCPMPELTRQLFELEALLQEKYPSISVKVSFGSGKVNVAFLNSRNNIHQGIDEENLRPIEFLKLFGAKETRKEAGSQQSRSILQFEESKLKPVIAGIKAQPTPENSNRKTM